VHVFSIMNNEERLLPYFLRHYETFADRIFIFDEHSTDRTAEIAMAHPKVTFDRYELSVGIHEAFFNKCFIDAYKKHSRGVADWIMIVDADELVYNKDMLSHLKMAREDGKHIIKTTAYEVVSETFPSDGVQIYDECKYGLRHRNFDKAIVFDPNLDVELTQGRHKTILPDGTNPDRYGLLLLHCGHLSREFFLSRYSTSYKTRKFRNRKIRFHIKKGLSVFDNKPLIKII